MNAAVILCMQHSGRETIVIFDRLSERYMSLIKRYKCCFVYESNWDDDDDSELSWILSPIKSNTIAEGINGAGILCPSIVESCCAHIDDPRVLVLGMLDIDYSCIDLSSNYIICTPNNMEESRLPSYSMLGMCPLYRSFDSGAVMTSVYNDSIKEDTTSELEFNNNISCSPPLYTYVSYCYTGINY